MADRGIRIPIVADVVDWLRGTRDVERSLDDVARDLDQLARRADDSSDDIAGDFDNAFRQIRRDADRTGDQVAADLDQGLRGGGIQSAGAEIGEEFSQNFGEAVRQGNPAGALFETVTSLGPVFGLAGIALAAGAGIVNGLIQGAGERSEAFQQTVADLVSGNYSTLIEDAKLTGKALADALREGYISSSMSDQQLAAALGVESVEDAWLEVARLASDTGLGVGVITDAILGNADAVAAVKARQDEVNTSLSQNEQQQRTIGAANRDLFDTLQAQEDTLDGQSAALGDILANADAVRDANQRTIDIDKARVQQQTYITEQMREQAILARRISDTVAGTPQRQVWAVQDYPFSGGSVVP